MRESGPHFGGVAWAILWWDLRAWFDAVFVNRIVVQIPAGPGPQLIPIRTQTPRHPSITDFAFPQRSFIMYLFSLIYLHTFA